MQVSFWHNLNYTITRDMIIILPGEDSFRESMHNGQRNGETRKEKQSLESELNKQIGAMYTKSNLKQEL